MYEQCLDATMNFAIRNCKNQEDMGTDVIQIGGFLLGLHSEMCYKMSSTPKDGGFDAG
jgi:hypothetical protein